MLVGQDLGLGYAAGAAAGGLLPGAAGIVDPEGNHPDGIAVPVDVLCDGISTAQRGRQHKADLALLHHIGGAIPLAGLGARIGHQGHAEGSAVKVGGLTGIAHVELDVIGPLEREKVVWRRRATMAWRRVGRWRS